jgi:hypothetical protein
VKALIIGLLALGGLTAGGVLGLRMMTAEVEEEDGRLAGQATVTATPATATPTPDLSLTPCPADWNAYEDPSGGYSFCYPAEMELTTVSVAPSTRQLPPGFQELPEMTGTLAALPFQTAADVSSPSPYGAGPYTGPYQTGPFRDNKVGFGVGTHLGWSVEAFGTGSLLLCQDGLSPDRNRTATTVTIGGGKTIAGCYQEYYPPEDPDRIAKNIAFEVASLGPGDKIVGSVNWTGPNWAETEALAKQILGTLVIR